MKIIRSIFFLFLLILNFLPDRLTSNEVIKQEPPLWNREILDSFFRNLFENTAAGYVIYGEKPIYLGSFCRPEWLMPGSAKHKEAIQTFLALKILNNLSKNSKSANYILTTQKLEDVSSQNNGFVIINRKAFFEVIKKNFVLFKYKFGHDVTPEKLLDKLINSDDGFSKLFGGEIALQGIVLGYETNNSISYERASVFTQIATSNTPSSPPNKLLPFPTTEEEMINRIENLSLGKSRWKKVKEETKDFSYYHSQNPDDKLKIPFSFHENSTETKTLFKKYRKAQTKLNRVLSEKNFLDRILKNLQIDHRTLQIHPENITGQLISEEERSLSQILARSIQYTFSEQISFEFMEGMRAAQDIYKNASDIDVEELEFFEILREQTFSSSNRKTKVQKSQQFLHEVASRQNVRCLVPDKLYICTLKNGIPEKSLTLKYKNIIIDYLIKDINGNPIIGTYKGEEPSHVNLEKLIPGFAHGILGMGEGELRDIYIHPDFAYGTHSTFGEGNALQVQVKLIRIEDNTDAVESCFLQPIDVIHLTPNIESCEEFESLQKKYNYFCGMKTWLHYKKAEPLVHLNPVIDQMLLKDSRPLSDQERDLISRLDWIIYQE